jgi:SAM-dependent methyltransferase
VIEQKKYWDRRFIEGEIWGAEPCPSAVISINFLKQIEATNIFVPGCGYGRNSLYFGQNGLDVIATDISDVAINQAINLANKVNCNKVSYFSGDLFESKLKFQQKFDAIYLSNVIHLFLKKEREELFNRMSSLLKQNGLFIFTCISTSDSKNYGQGIEVEDNTFANHGKNLHFFTEEEIPELLTPNYKILEQKLHIQTETDPSGASENLQLWFTVGQKL